MSKKTDLTGAVRRALLLKVISRPQPTRDDVASVIELTATKVLELLEAQSLSLLLLEGKELAFRYVYYSPSLWAGYAEREQEFVGRRDRLLTMRIPLGKGLVSKVVETGKPLFFSPESKHTRPMLNLGKEMGFDVRTMLIVPLMTNRVIGAIEVINKEPFSQRPMFEEADLKVLEEVADYTAVFMHRMMDPEYRLSDVDSARYIARFTGLPLVTEEDGPEIDDKLLEVVGEALIRREGVLPYKQLSPGCVSVFMANPLDYARREAFSHASEMTIEEVSVVPASLIDHVLARVFRERAVAVDALEADTGIAEIADLLGEQYSAADGTGGSGGELESEESAPVIQMANRIIEDAYISGASDIHIEPQENEVSVRYRVDGVCGEKLRLPKAVSGALVARLKIMANLDIAEKRLPQDGRIVFKQYTKKKLDIDLRVATGPMNHGEKVCMRILDKSKSALPITALGFSEENLLRYRECIQQPYGMILHCGPTGSGKSMTLFSALREVASPEVNIHTAEDPIEYTIPGINQMQMHKAIGLTFASALRCYLRMDPDIILVGEIRDRETAEIAVEASLTGHLLLSTLHTNDAPSTVARLGDMGVEPFMISASMLCVCAQRLLRRLNAAVREEYVPEGNEREILERALGWSGPVYRVPKAGVGYKGRVGIHELMINNEELTRAINNRAETAELKRVAMRSGMKTLHQDSMLKVRQGTTSMMEALSNVPPDMITL